MQGTKWLVTHHADRSIDSRILVAKLKDGERFARPGENRFVHVAGSSSSPSTVVQEITLSPAPHPYLGYVITCIHIENEEGE